jgi:hypothetical protein
MGKQCALSGMIFLTIPGSEQMQQKSSSCIFSASFIKIYTEIGKYRFTAMTAYSINDEQKNHPLLNRNAVVNYNVCSSNSTLT